MFCFHFIQYKNADTTQIDTLFWTKTAYILFQPKVVTISVQRHILINYVYKSEEYLPPLPLIQYSHACT